MAINHRSNDLLRDALRDASKLVSQARALGEQGASQAVTLWNDAAGAEENVAVLLEAAGREKEAGLHRASAATCYEKAQVFPRAVTLLQAALAASLAESFQRRLRRQLKRCLRKANVELAADARRRRKLATPV